MWCMINKIVLLIILIGSYEAFASLSDIALSLIYKECAAKPESCLKNHPEFYLQSYVDPSVKTLQQSQGSQVKILNLKNDQAAKSKVLVSTGQGQEKGIFYIKSKSNEEYIMEYKVLKNRNTGADQVACSEVVRIQNERCETVPLTSEIQSLFQAQVECTKGQSYKRDQMGDCAQLTTAMRECSEINCDKSLYNVYAKGEIDSLSKKQNPMLPGLKIRSPASGSSKSH